ncbi:hypothetical protein E4U56_005210 [Claviceps arundinis]|uniref:F-box domain-containing protein n=1 Tax=Claviceps arundinis TaxID=1623583 RepID=A0A9P7MXL1_9HYPO|nr:hypothetical protein E4U56_005210 [Claviceps arundinis]
MAATMPVKRKLVEYNDEDGCEENSLGNGVAARHRDATPGQEPLLEPKAKRPRAFLDPNHTTDLSDELLMRIFSFLDEKTLLAISPVCRRFNRIASDSHLWRPHYYLRFILPRACRIPGFRTGSTRSSSKLRYSADRFIWADGGWGRRGGFVATSAEGQSAVHQDSVDWKKQYRLRDNWARGHCAVEEVQVRRVEQDAAAVDDIDNDNDDDDEDDDVDVDEAQVPGAEWQTLVKVVDGLAVTVDGTSGLRAWHLKMRRLVAQTALPRTDTLSQATCLAVDDVLLANMRVLDVAIGYEDGTFEVWRLDIKRTKFSLCYRHAKSCLGDLVAITYAHPYLLTASRLGSISLFSFGNAHVAAANTFPTDAGSEKTSNSKQEPASSPSRVYCANDDDGDGDKLKSTGSPAALPRPRLLTSLKSHSTRPPLALSIRPTTGSVVASIAYTFDGIGGWCIGIQDLDIKTSRATSGTSKPDMVVASKVAYSLPIRTRQPPMTSSPSSRSFSNRLSPPPPIRYLEDEEEDGRGLGLVMVDDDQDDGPIRLCYSHPYLLATLPDNTLLLHICTSTASSLSISPGIRLWGHTSGISDAEITPRGKAVSISTRGNEIRVWELEGRVGGSSVALRPRRPPREESSMGLRRTSEAARSKSSRRTSADVNPDPDADSDAEDRKNWVGFDDEMVVVLKEASDGRESLMVYDFT